jgi:FixJ family two-component response regulator
VLSQASPAPEALSNGGDDALADKPFTVFVVDDDESIRRALKRLLKVHGYHVITFESAEDFLASRWLHAEGCIILDMRLPGMSGQELHEKLSLSKQAHPVIFMTAHDTAQSAKWASKTDAVAYLRKPFDQQTLLDALHLAATLAKAARVNAGLP